MDIWGGEQAWSDIVTSMGDIFCTLESICRICTFRLVVITVDFLEDGLHISKLLHSPFSVCNDN